MTERNFIPVNQKSIEPSDAISFGVYKDGSEWKSIGERGVYKIEAHFSPLIGQNKLQFSAALPRDADSNVTFYDSFNLNSDYTYLEPNKGFFRPKIVVGTVGVKTGFEIENIHSEQLIIAQAFTWFYFDATADLEIGFKVYLTRNSTNDRVFITPLDPSTIIYGRKDFVNYNYETWTDSSAKHPVIYKYKTVYVLKISSTEFVIGGTVGEHLKET